MQQKRPLKFLLITLIVLSLLIGIVIYILVQRGTVYERISMTDGLGINIHEVSANEIELLAELGVTWVRIDLTWERIETEPGDYEYSETNYDELAEAIEANGMQPYFILSYGNPLYSGDQSIETSAGQDHFASFVRETVQRYKGMGGVWEIWNEPNYDEHWLTEPTYEPYADLVHKAAPIIKDIDPTATVAGPAMLNLNGDSLVWMEELFKRDVLEYLDAISVHPYRHTPPETVSGDYEMLRELIDQYTEREDVEIFSGEWGYSLTSLPDDVNEHQANYLVRMMLVNEMNDIPISIWYGLRDNGTDWTNELHHFGLMDAQSQQKPAYTSFNTFIDLFTDYQYQKRWETHDEVYALEFKNPNAGSLYALWTTSDQTQSLTLPLEAGIGTIMTISGQEEAVEWTEEGFNLDVSGSPVYLMVEE
ncbi:cellulase family glycosylhydrolase [Alkalicoccobacillus murimartini]|uniref:Beta-xylosidase n=1 Tax=Alkalicoccobacillus murimartini TaxID=171685 RepID=A0ABT9YGE4_9BACI|nr:cellulase family glycosylhydrolase [Alkalicoccobacillus murimartini]MDQ0206912.1 beta-xylosidase [Alkalicoccobacillus murimartini]